MDRHRGERSGDGFGDGGRRMPSRWSPDRSSHEHDWYSIGGGGGEAAEGFSGGGIGGAARYHPYRGSQHFPPPPPASSGGGGGFRGGGVGFRSSGIRQGGFEPPLQMGGPSRGGFSGRGGHGDGHKFAKLFIGSVPRTATEEDIRPLFEEHGDVVEVAFIKDRKTGEQQGCCFVKYANSEQADRAIRALHNQHTLPGGLGPIQVRYADGEKEHHGAVEDKLFVASLNKQATAKEIEEIFSPYGLVEDVYIMRDSSRQSRGCGFVKFASREMAAAALKALNGVYVMRGCDQPLVVRFADPKRPRPGEPSASPAFGGRGFSPQSEAALVIRPTSNLEEPRNGWIPSEPWRPMSPKLLGPPSQPGVLGPTGGPTNGATLTAPPSTEQSFNPAMAAIRPVAGQQISPLQMPFMPPQSFPPLKLNQSQQSPASCAQTINLQAPNQQLGQLQVPQSSGLTTFKQTLPSQQLPGIGGQTSTSQSLIQQNASSVAMQTPVSVQQQAMRAIAQQQFPASNTAQQLLQQPIQQFPSQLPQMLLQQQAQALQSSFQSSQQAIIQLQQQLQLMQQQQVSQTAKPQSAWSGPPPTCSTSVSTSSSTSAMVMPSTIPAKPSLDINTSPSVPLTSNWTEHTSPEGFKYYYNSITRESRWEKPEEFTLLEQQQQKLGVQQLPSQLNTQSQTQVQPTQQVSQTQQVQSQIMKQQAQMQLQPSSAEFNYARLQTTGSVDLSRVLQGIQAVQEWAWKNNSAGS